MFLQLAFKYANSLQKTALILNTVVFIMALIIMELVYSEAPQEKRQYLKYFLPLFLVLGGLLTYAAYNQLGKS